MSSETPIQPSQGKQPSDFGVEIITPLEVRKEINRPDSIRYLRSTAVTIFLFLMILASMAAGGFFLIRHVSKHPAGPIKDTERIKPLETDIIGKEDMKASGSNKERTGKTESSFASPDQQPETLPVQPTDAAGFEPEKETAEKELATFLKLKKEIEEKGGSIWGGDEYDTMVTLSQKGDRLLMDRSFAAATRTYAQAVKTAKGLIENSGTVFQKLVEQGRIALENGDSEIALQKFSTALRIHPSDESARRNLDRAEKLDEVNRLITSGENHEENHRPGFALADFEKALQLDPESGRAQKGVNRLKAKIADEQFQKLMSEGLTAYHDGDYQRARTALLKAKSFRSDAPEVKSALSQVEEAVRLNAIEKLREKAMSAEQTEKWEQALKSYLEVLDMDPEIGFAARGKSRALEHIQVSKRIEFFLGNPDAMASDRQLENAIRLIEDAEKLEQRGPNFNARLNRLKTLVEIAGTPVKVIIDSDNLTEITVYKVGRLGKFTVRELSLRPGTYTAVGSRNGYRDVRLNIIVKPRQDALRVSVICDMKV